MTIRDRAIQRAYEKLLELEFWAVRSDAAAVVDAVLGEIEEPDAKTLSAMDIRYGARRFDEPATDAMSAAFSAAIKHIRKGGE